MSVIERDHDELVDAVRRFGYASAAPSIGDPEARWREVREKITAMAERQRGAVEIIEEFVRQVAGGRYPEYSVYTTQVHEKLIERARGFLGGQSE